MEDQNDHIYTCESKTSKARYCKFCGELIDNDARKCTGCGKQFFRFPKKVAAIVSLSVLFAALVGFNVFQYIDRLQLESIIIDQFATEQSLNDQLDSSRREKNDIKLRLEKSESENRELSYENGTLSQINDELWERVWDAELKANILDSTIVFVASDKSTGPLLPPKKTLYHKFDCPKFQEAKYFKAFDDIFAEESGLDPCPLCHQ